LVCAQLEWPKPNMMAAKASPTCLSYMDKQMRSKFLAIACDAHPSGGKLAPRAVCCE
jgi:hypothetical protein